MLVPKRHPTWPNEPNAGVGELQMQTTSFTQEPPLAASLL